MKHLKPVSSALCFSGLPLLGASIYLLSFSNTAIAQDGFHLEVRENAVYDDNPLMRSADNAIDTIRGLETTALVGYNHNSNSSVFNTTTTIRHNQFDISRYNSTDFFLDINYRKEKARWAWGLNGSFDYDTPRTADESTLGLVQLSDRRMAYSISPNLIYKLSPRKSLGLNASITEKNYSSGSASTDHRTRTISPFYSYDIERNTISVAYQYQQYEALSRSELNVDSTGPFLTWRNDITPNTAIETSFGMLGTRYTGIGQSGEWEINPIYSFGVEHSGKQNTLTLSINRARQALTNGTETDITTLKIQDQFMIAPLWALKIQTEYKKVKQSSFSSTDLDNSYSAYIDTKYDISRDLKFSMSYRYAQDSYITDREDASRNVVRASLNYKLK